VALPARASEDKGSEEKAAHVFETRCDVCHSKGSAVRVRGSRDGWERTVARIIQKNGAKITDEEAKAIMEHLEKEYGT
jgi:cytochrome c5